MKDTIIRDIYDTKSFGILYKEYDDEAYKYLIDPYYNYIIQATTEETGLILEEINKTNRLERIYGLGCFFKLKDDPKIYTIMNNNYGCAGTGVVEEYEYGSSSFTLPIAKNLSECKTISSYTSNDILDIVDRFSYDPAYGLTTFYIMNKGFDLYVSGFVNNRIEYYPRKLLAFQSKIKKIGEVKGGSIIILLEDHNLLYWGENDDNFMTSPNKRNPGLVTLNDSIEDIWFLDTMVVYKHTNGSYFAFGYSDMWCEYILGLDVTKNTKYPFPGARLTHAPFNESESKITKIVSYNYGVAVLHENGNLYITGVDKVDDNSRNACRLISDNCSDIVFGCVSSVGFTKKNDNRIYLTDTLKMLPRFIMRDNIYHPSIGLL